MTLPFGKRASSACSMYLTPQHPGGRSFLSVRFQSVVLAWSRRYRATSMRAPAKRAAWATSHAIVQSVLPLLAPTSNR